MSQRQRGAIWPDEVDRSTCLCLAGLALVLGAIVFVGFPCFPIGI